MEDKYITKMLGEDAIVHHAEKLEANLARSLKTFLVKLEFRLYESPLKPVAEDILYRDHVDWFSKAFIELGQFEGWSNEELESVIKDLFNLKGEFMNSLYKLWQSLEYTPKNRTLKDNVLYFSLGLAI